MSVEVNKELNELTVKRRSVKGRITKFSKYLNSLPAGDLSVQDRSQLCTKLEKFTVMFDSFDDLQSRIEVYNEDNLDDELQEREEIEDSFHSNIAFAKVKLGTISLAETSGQAERESATYTPNDSQCAHSCGGQQDLGFRLPVIQISNFDGTYFKWLEFRDTFESLIHNNTRIKPINKFHYLCSYLQGEAARVISNLEVSDKNYSEAWDLLCERYNNKRQLTTNHLNSLFKIDPISRESDKSLRFLVDHVTKNLRALNNLGQPTDQWDTLIIHIMSSKLDNITSLKWEEHRSSSSKEMPSLDDFFKFLKGRADVLESVQRSKQDKQVSSGNNNTHNKYQRANKSVNVISANPVNFEQVNRGLHCFVCKGKHRIYDCPAFLSMSIEERIQKASSLKLCLNCLRSGHIAGACRLSSCRICNARHNTMLHKPHTQTITATPSIDNVIPTSTTSTSTPNSVTSDASTSSISMSVTSTSQVVLSTALVDIVNPDNNQVETVKVLLDCGSMSSFITSDLKQRLQLDTQVLDATTIVGIGNSSLNFAPERGTVTVKSRCNPFSVTLSCLVLPEITATLPRRPINMKQFSFPSNISLADPSFNVPSKVDMLIGADLFWDLIGPRQQSLGANLPTLRESKLGWFLAGHIRDKQTSNLQVDNSNTSIQCNFSALESLHTKLSRFWELEELPTSQKASEAGVDAGNPCETHFMTHTTRLEDGRFSVRLPLVTTPDCLGDSYSVAKKRFLNLEKRFERHAQLKSMYSDFMKEYEDLGHMSESSLFKPPVSYFIPHHAVMREKSESTKLRVVYDASCRTSSGFSINDLQMIGPNIQDSLFNILVRFREYNYVMTGDIEKMYRQVQVDDCDRDLQLILWRSDPSSPLKTYRLNTVTYGFASASYLSTRCIWQLGEESYDPLIKTILQNDFYVDDLITGAQTEQELLYIQDSVVRALSSGCFNLRKFRSNSRGVLQNTLASSHDNLTLSQTYDTLGLNWNPDTDTLQFPMSVQGRESNVTTKRSILSQTFQIFDPLGLLSLCTIKPKILMQRLWASKIEWDSVVPSDIQRSWKRFIDNLSFISHITIPRNVIRDLPVSVELHAFSDASQAAYGACIYVKSIDQAGNTSILLYCAKARVAPSKAALTIPRLELCGALLAARLLCAVKSALRRQISKSYLWTDSSVVLGWIATEPSRLKVWVSNRVRQVQEMTSTSSWRYVPTAHNPADLASRGVDPHQVQDSTLWWQGPSFLSRPESEWPTLYSHKCDNLPELKVHTTLVTDSIKASIDISRYSKLQFLQRVIAYIYRFIHNCKNPHDKHTGSLTVDELEGAFTCLVRMSQQDSFPHELQTLQRQDNLKLKSSIVSLNPFLDSQGLLRVGGRLCNSQYEYEKKHPVLLHAKHHLTKLLFTQEHHRLLHAGPQLLLASIRERIWPLGGRELARRTARSCIKCRRISAQPLHNIMGNLPAQRITPDYPFSTVAVDFAGPFMITDRKGRGCKITKAYLCLFICFRSKCVHLEAVSELSRDAFMLTLRRFIARREI
ncbi:uncharacterized protein LOC126379907 isoform X2 [Pectinophora gossypiella]|uniref:uncharacterized protein LOC126379881 isoform X2 n=1 Tax=Pectinophora gossypiella TaxID=13191 RepID=UPI00214E4EB9|nr:uncharacterized protein LOC126379881 isoform X2 [Pectinophora gossypiella]XP_049884862.1 uncharacterized protein LOC126379907 isoform X2 [Pectinophora gossypiella]